MKTEKIKALLKTVKTDPKAQVKLTGLTKPEDENGIIRYYAEAAKRLDFDVSEEEIREMLAEQIKTVNVRTEAAAAGIESLPDNELDEVAGGDIDYPCSNSLKQKYECKYTYKDRENCWNDDACDKNFLLYQYYQCEHNYAGHTCSAADALDCSSFMF